MDQGHSRNIFFCRDMCVSLLPWPKASPLWPNLLPHLYPCPSAFLVTEWSPVLTGLMDDAQRCQKAPARELCQRPELRPDIPRIGAILLDYCAFFRELLFPCSLLAHHSMVQKGRKARALPVREGPTVKQDNRFLQDTQDAWPICSL